MVKVFPNITTSDIEEVKYNLQKLQNVSRWVHFDIIDGQYAKTNTVTIEQIKNLPLLYKINLSFHLMVVNPVKFVQPIKNLKAKVIIAQIERMPDQVEFVKKVKKYKMQVGLAIDDGTPADKIDKKILADLDEILVMTIKAGWSGRSFKPSRLNEVRKLRSLRQKYNYHYKIAVDGGVNEKTIGDCSQAGADYFFMHSAIWKYQNIKKRISYLRRLALQAQKKGH